LLLRTGRAIGVVEPKGDRGDFSVNLGSPAAADGEIRIPDK